MYNLDLKLNERTNKIGLFVLAQELLDLYYARNPSSNYTRSFLEDTYPTFYGLSNLLVHSYTSEELIQLANQVFYLKGSMDAVNLFCKFFDISLTIKNVGFDVNIDLELVNLYVDDIQLFELLFNQLLFELLFYLNSDFLILDMHFSIKLTNELMQVSNTTLVNNLELGY